MLLIFRDFVFQKSNIHNEDKERSALPMRSEQFNKKVLEREK